MEIKSTDLPICDRYKTGTQITKAKIDDVFLPCVLNKEEEKEEVVVINLDSVDEKILTIDDFLEDFKFKN